MCSDHHPPPLPKVARCVFPLEGCLVDAPALRIGQVAQASGLPVKTVRFYCDEGLIRTVARSAGGYRLFDPGVVAELTLIRALRSMDVPLPELRRILDGRRSGHCHCNTLKRSIHSRIESIDHRLAELVAMKAELSQLLLSWQECGGTRSA
jgi:MerR family copper efflux transcriptional regulator